MLETYAVLCISCNSWLIFAHSCNFLRFFALPILTTCAFGSKTCAFHAKNLRIWCENLRVWYELFPEFPPDQVSIYSPKSPPLYLPLGAFSQKAPAAAPASLRYLPFSSPPANLAWSDPPQVPKNALLTRKTAARPWRCLIFGVPNYLSQKCLRPQPRHCAFPGPRAGISFAHPVAN